MYCDYQMMYSFFDTHVMTKTINKLCSARNPKILKPTIKSKYILFINIDNWGLARAFNNLVVHYFEKKYKSLLVNNTRMDSLVLSPSLVLVISYFRFQG